MCRKPVRRECGIADLRIGTVGLFLATRSHPGDAGKPPCIRNDSVVLRVLRVKISVASTSPSLDPEPPQTAARSHEASSRQNRDSYPKLARFRATACVVG